MHTVWTFLWCSSVDCWGSLLRSDWWKVSASSVDGGDDKGEMSDPIKGVGNGQGFFFYGCVPWLCRPVKWPPTRTIGQPSLQHICFTIGQEQRFWYNQNPTPVFDQSVAGQWVFLCWISWCHFWFHSQCGVWIFRRPEVHQTRQIVSLLLIVPRTAI